MTGYDAQTPSKRIVTRFGDLRERERVAGRGKAIRGLALLAIIFVAAVTFYHCPMRMLLGMPCPSCGYTTALVSLLSLNIQGAFEAHPLFPLMTLSLLYLIFRDYFTLKRGIEIVLLGGTLAAMIMVWLYRVVL